MASETVLIVYAGCSTCKKAARWLDDHGVRYASRSIVDSPPSRRELDGWVRESGVGVRKWLNTSGLSYRALGKAKVDKATETQIMQWLSEDPKLIKRPVLVTKNTVAAGFREASYEEIF
jgi:arsenate reductase